MRNLVRKCRYCGTDQELKSRENICRLCFNEKSLERWNSLPKEEKKKRGRTGYLSLKKKQISNQKNDIDFTIKKWLRKWKNRWTESTLLSSRKNLDIESLTVLAKQGLEKFPYMDFSIDKKTKQALWASVDRIDPTKDYSDINNLQFLPNWLNNAKLDLTTEELKNMMNEVLSKNLII